MNRAEYEARFTPKDTPGWDAITAACEAENGPGEPLGHWGSVVKYMMGGPDPLDGVSIYWVGGDRPHLHYVSYGMSALYFDPEAAGGEGSNWGLEFTFRLAVPDGVAPAKDDLPLWPISLMNNLARYVFQSGKWFEHGHFLTAKGPIKADADTTLTGIAFALDPKLGRIETPHGAVEFIQLVGITDAELTALFDGSLAPLTLLDALNTADPLMRTDLTRQQNAVPLA